MGKGKPKGDGTRLELGGLGPVARLLASNQATGVRLPDPALEVMVMVCCVPGRAVRRGLPRLDRRVRLPRGALGNRLTGRLPDFESGGGGSNPPSRIRGSCWW